jgi:hypothetical protein
MSTNTKKTKSANPNPTIDIAKEILAEPDIAIEMVGTVLKGITGENKDPLVDTDKKKIEITAVTDKQKNDLFDLEKGINDEKIKEYELGDNTNIKIESTNSDFDLDIFKQIGLNFDRSTNKLSINIPIYSGQKANSHGNANYLQTFPIDDQLKIIAMYFELETLRYTNKQIYDKTEKHTKLLSTLYYIAMILNVVVPYFSSLITKLPENLRDYTPYFCGASTIITMLSYVLTRFLMSTSAGLANYLNIQESITKLRFTVETIIMGSYMVDEDNNITTTKKLQEVGLSNFKLDNVLQKINTDLNNIYQLDALKDALNKDKHALQLLDIAKSESNNVIKVFEKELSNVMDQIKNSPALNIIKKGNTNANIDTKHITIEFD